MQIPLTLTISLQGVSGHLPSWHEAPQMCPHISLIIVQGCKHCCPGFSQSPAWHIAMHLCRPHISGLLHGRPHEISFTWHGTAFLSSCLPWHHLCVNTLQGGHVGSLWQLCSISWSHECCREHGRLQAGLLVPHGTGGKIISAPHSQYNSSKLLCQQGKHLPIKEEKKLQVLKYDYKQKCTYPCDIYPDTCVDHSSGSWNMVMDKCVQYQCNIIDCNYACRKISFFCSVFRNVHHRPYSSSPCKQSRDPCCRIGTWHRYSNRRLDILLYDMALYKYADYLRKWTSAY